MECSPYVLADRLLNALASELTETRAGMPGRLSVYPHPEPAVEFCEMGWVGVGQIAPAERKPSGGCGVLTWTVTFTMGVQRCYPVKDKNAAPSTVEVDSAARDVLDDGEAMRRAVASAFDDDEPTVTSWRSVPPQGGSHGSRMEVQVRMSWGLMVEPTSPMLPGDPRG